MGPGQCKKAGQQHNILGNTWKRSKALIVATATVITILGAVVAFRPNISAELASPFNPNAPFDTRFIVSNNSYLPINKMVYRFVKGKILYKSDIHEFINGKGITVRDYKIGRLRSGERTTVFLPSSFKFSAPVEYADYQFMIACEYIPFLPWTYEERFRFTTIGNEWFPRSVSD